MQIHAYSLTYNYDKDARAPGDIFARMAELSNGFTGIEYLLLESIDDNIRATSVLSGVEYGSIKAWLSQVLRGIDDSDLGKLEWKSILGKMLVKAKWAVIRFLEKDRPAQNKDLVDLQKELFEYQIETGIKIIPAYRPINLNLMSDRLVMINSATTQTSSEESVILHLDGNPAILSRRLVITQERKVEILTTEIERFRDKDTVLVKKPDYLGNSMWDVIYRNHKESMQMGDIEFLTKFHNNESNAQVHPGDSLEVEIDGAHSIGNNGETIQKRFTIRRVSKVIRNRDNQKSIFDV